MAPPDPSRPILRLSSVDSTQRTAFELAERGAPDGAVVVAETQTAGRGRRGRRWYDVPGDSLLVSILVRPRLPIPDLPQLSLAAAVAVADALETVAALSPRLKWPNDVRIGERKIAGILLESRITTAPVVVVGVGVNLGQRTFAGELAATATSVAIETGAPVGPETMLEALLPAFDTWRARLENEGFAPVRTRWLELTDTIGRVLDVDGRHATAVGLDADGALVLEDAGGVRRRVAGGLAGVRGGCGD